MIQFDNVTKKYGDKKALDQVNFTIREGEIFGLIGHNGAGKSTAIKILVSIITATSGEVSVNDQLLSEHRDAIKNTSVMFRIRLIFSCDCKRKNIGS